MLKASRKNRKNRSKLSVSVDGVSVAPLEPAKPPSEPGQEDDIDPIALEFGRLCEIDKNTRGCAQLSLFPTATSNLNWKKNRYRDVLPAEHSRVKLRQINGPGSDYINANFICHEKGAEPLYISCQAPVMHTIADHWRMIWEQKSSVVVMLTRLVENNRHKADKYWPAAAGECLEFDDFIVRLKSVDANKAITKRVFILAAKPSESSPKPNLNSKGHAAVNSPEVAKSQGPSSERVVCHLHYQAWPDCGVPQSTGCLRKLIKKTNKYRHSGLSRGLNGPIIIHCSAGIGRSGTFIAVHITLLKICRAIRELESKSTLASTTHALSNTNNHDEILFHDSRSGISGVGKELSLAPSLPPLRQLVMDIIFWMRQQRPGMVQTLEQYRFVNAVIEESLLEGMQYVGGQATKLEAYREALMRMNFGFDE